MFNNSPAPTIMLFMRYVGKYYRARQATDDNKILRMRFAYCITKATYIHSECVILLLFHGNNGYAEVSNCYVIRMLPVLFNVNPEVILWLTAKAKTNYNQGVQGILSVITVYSGNDYDSSLLLGCDIV